MAHFAKINESNIVTQVVVVNDSDGNNDTNGQNFLNNLFKTTHTWKKTSYNTYGNTHRLGGTPYRKNFASVGFTYDSSRDAFIEPKPYNSWTLNETTCLWESPVAYPSDGKSYEWDEDNKQWVEA
tara:strand:- start:49 stop:423 length:375 start_codon:yes stop_codon:yes gene_type:complete